MTGYCEWCRRAFILVDPDDEYCAACIQKIIEERLNEPDTSTYRMIITGTRHTLLPADTQRIRDTILDWPAARDRTITLVHGACPRGVDQIAVTLAAEREHISHEPHPADWQTHSWRAGPIRNTAMVKLGADVCLAFPAPDSKGTHDCADKCEKAGIPTWRFPLDQDNW